MSSSQLNDYLNIVREVTAKHTRNPIHLIIHTDSVQFSGDIKSYKNVPTNITGGTAFQPVLDEIKRLEKAEHVVPSVVIWGTDLYGELSEADYNQKKFPFHKKLHWLITGSDLQPKIGKYWFLDEIGK
jgi:predicted metal-dependent peptidase